MPRLEVQEVEATKDETLELASLGNIQSVPEGGRSWIGQRIGRTNRGSDVVRAEMKL